MLLPSGKGRLHGPPKTCSGVGLFEFFLPLMVHCGTLLDLNRSRLHPVLSAATIWSSQEREILGELDHFQATLNQVTRGAYAEEVQEKDPRRQSVATNAEDSETAHIAKTVAGYATHIVNVLRILVGSKCELLLPYGFVKFTKRIASQETSPSTWPLRCTRLAIELQVKDGGLKQRHCYDWLCC